MNPKALTYFSYRFLILLLMMSFCLSASAADLAAQVILAKGQVSAVSTSGKARILKRRSKIYSGDVIKTGNNASVQLRFIDKALMTIKPGSELSITSYLYDDGSRGTSKKEVVMSLVTGGFRTITGIIGKGDKSAYRVQTPAASVGIRGTNYEIQQESGGSFVMAVYVGGISVENEAGSIDLGLGSDFNYTRVSSGQPPQGLLVVPASLTTNAADEEQEEQEEEAQEAEGSGEEDQASSEETNSEETESESGGEASNALVVNNIEVSEGIEVGESKGAVEKKKQDEEEETVETVTEEAVVKTTVSVPSIFEDPYSGIDIQTSPYPNILSDEEWSLAQSHNISALNMQLGYSIGSDGLPNFNSQLESPNAVNVNNFIAFDFSAAGQIAYLDFNYTTFDSVNNVGTPVTVMLYIDADVMTAQDLVDHLNSELNYNSVPVEVSLVDDPAGQRFVFQPIDSGDDYISQMSLTFDSGNSIPDQQLMAQLGGSSSSPSTDWFWSTNTNLSLGYGSWRADNDSPIWVSVSGSDDSNGDFIVSFLQTSTRDTDETVDSYKDFKSCANNWLICDIQINEVNDANNGNIRWGAWLASPGDGVDINLVSGGSEFNYVDESNLIFGVFGERADINDLTGSVSFAGGGDCTDYGQCIGFADDGIVSNFSGEFDVDFGNGAITNGQLNIETMNMETSDVQSYWDVQFTGQMMTDEYDEIVYPEFYTQTVGGHIHQGGMDGAIITNKVIGTVGGFFVNPGDIFAGGFNLGTSDNINKHTTGVFTLIQE